MRRRQFLASGAVVLSVGLAGCGHPPVVLDMDEATAEAIADEASRTVDPESEAYPVVVAARENGTATRRGRHELFAGVDTVRIGDAFYAVSETRLGSTEVTVYEVLVDLDPEDSTPELGEIGYSDLPETDRERLGPILSDRDHPTREGYDIGVGYGTVEEVGNESVFVPDRQYDILRYEGDRYRIAVDSRTAREAEYRYELREVAADVGIFAGRVREQYLFTLAGLSGAEREVVETAIDDGYFQDDDAFRSVIDRFREHEGIHEADSDGTWLVEYEGVEYLTYAEW